MTPAPLTAEALRGDLLHACFDPGSVVGPRGGLTTDEWRADACMKQIAPLLAAHQQVTAERDEAQAISEGLARDLAKDRVEHARYRASAEEMWETAKRHGGQMLAEKRRADAAEAAEDDRFAVEYTTARGALDYEHMARVLSGRLRRMDRRAAAANRRADAATSDLARLRAEGEAKDRALKEADACLSIVEPRSDTAEYLRTLGVVRTALARAATAREGQADA